MSAVIEQNVSLRPYNTFGIEASARQFARFRTTDELQDVLQQATAPDLLVLGGGSNLLLTRNFDGLVLKNDIGGIRVVREDDRHVFLEAGAGVSWHQFVLHCLQHNYAGVENLALIPGNVGASPMQNI